MTGAACPVPVKGVGFVRGTLDFIDCQALSIGETGYRVLAAPGSSLSAVLTALFTILVALVGYRLMLGEPPRLRDGVVTMVKIGAVLALATGWSGYRTLFFDVALRAPAELANEIGSPLHLPGAGGGLADRLQGIDDAFAVLLQLDAQRTAAALTRPLPTPPTGIFAAPAPAAAAAAPSGPVLMPPVDVVSLRSARQFVLVGALGAFAATRLLAGILLAIGPFFIAFLLFDATRGLFVGWLRALAGAALGAFGASLVVGVGIAYFEPVLAGLVAQRTAGSPAVDGEAMLLPASLIFALAVLAILIGMARVAAGQRWPERLAPVVMRRSADRPPREPAGLARPSGGPLPVSSERSRALVVADAVAGQVRREQAPARIDIAGPRAAPMARATTNPDSPQAPLGQTFRRQPRGRVSAGMNRRNVS